MVMDKTLTWLVVIVGISFTLVKGMAIHERQKRQNYDALLQNKAFVESQINCVLGRGQCDRIGHRIKILVPEVVKTSVCKSCTEEEKGNVKKVADHVQVNYPKAWNEIRVQYKDENEELMEEQEAGEESGDAIVDEASENSVATDPSSTPSPKDEEETKAEKEEENQELLDSGNQEVEPSQESESPSQSQVIETDSEAEGTFQEQDSAVAEEQKVQEEVNMENKKDAVDTDADSVTN